MAQTPAGETILSERELRTCLASAGHSGGQARGYCPYHQGSTGYDLIVELDFGRFHCIVCGACGWTESGWNRWRSGSKVGSS